MKVKLPLGSFILMGLAALTTGIAVLALQSYIFKLAFNYALVPMFNLPPISFSHSVAVIIVLDIVAKLIRGPKQ